MLLITKYARSIWCCVAVQSAGRRAALELASDGGVFENEPAERGTDVVRSDEFEPDVIPVAQMRSTRTMWARKEQMHQQPAAADKQPPREVHLSLIHI